MLGRGHFHQFCRPPGKHSQKTLQRAGQGSTDKDNAHHRIAFSYAPGHGFCAPEAGENILRFLGQNAARLR